MTLITCKLDEIRTDCGTQPRTGISEAVVAEYAEAILRGDALPPPVCYWDGVQRILVDGFHRVHAHRQAGTAMLEVDQRAGTLREAILFSVGTNAHHGLRRSDDDKRKAVRLVLEDTEWGQWTDRRIAEVTNTSPSFVGKVRASLAPSVHVDTSEPGQVSTKTHAPSVHEDTKPEVRKAVRGGKEFEVKVKPRPEPAATPDADDDSPSAADLLDDMQADLRKAEARVAELEKALTEGGKDQVVTLMQRLDHGERRQGELQEDAAKLKQARDFYERQLARCGKAVGQRDLDKIAPAVEAFVRAHAKVAA